MTKSSQSIMKQIQNEIDSIINKDIKEFTMQATYAVKEANPVDTGWSKSNWIPTLDTAYQDVISGGEGSNFKSGSSPEFAAAMLNIVKFNYQKNTNLYITNNANYIAAVNEGYPNGKHAKFVETAIDRVILHRG